MSFTYKLNGAHDLSIKRGRLERVAGANEVQQRILVSLLHHWQEYFLNVPAGVPWYEVILGSKNKRQVELILRRAILDVPGVIGIASLRLQLINRDLDIYGVVEVQGEDGEFAFTQTRARVTSPGGNLFAMADKNFASTNWLFATD